MATSNEKIRDSVMRHQMDLLEYGTGLGERAAQRLTGTEEELRRVVLYYADKLSNADLSTKRARNLLIKFREEVTALRSTAWAEIQALLSSELQALTVNEPQFLKDTMERHIPYDLAWALPAAVLLRELFRSTPMDGKTLNEWINEGRRADRERILQAFRSGLGQREGVDSIVRRVMGTQEDRGAAQISGPKLIALALTATALAQALGKEQFSKGNSRFIRKEYFSAVLDSRTTPRCLELDQKVFNVGDGPVPPLHFNCRSVRLPYIAAIALPRRLYSSSTKDQSPLKVLGTVPPRTTYSEWFRRQSAKFQDEKLGPTLGAKYRAGNAPLHKYVVRKGNRWTFEDVVERGRGA